MKKNLQEILGGNFMNGKLYVFAFPKDNVEVYSNLEIEIYKMLANMEPVPHNKDNINTKPLAILARQSLNGEKMTYLISINSTNLVEDRLTLVSGNQEYIESDSDIQDVMSWTTDRLKKEALRMDVPVIYLLELVMAPLDFKESNNSKPIGFMENIDFMCAVSYNSKENLNCKVLRNVMEQYYDTSVISIDTGDKVEL